jgi:hypothetical protein
MKFNQFFPAILIILDLLASGGCWLSGDWKRGIYWIAAATLTACVTF